MEDAKAHAEQVLRDAQAQAEDMKKTAIEEARMRGYREGKEKADAEAEGLRRQIKAKETELENEYQNALDQMEPRLVEAITGIYEHIFHVELRSNRDILTHLIASTLHKAEGSKVRMGLGVLQNVLRLVLSILNDPGTVRRGILWAPCV